MNKTQKNEFSAGMCFGTCPAFSLELNRNTESIFIAEKFNINNDSLVEGTFRTLLNESVWDELDELINSFDIFSLEDNYEMFVTDMPTGITHIYFNDDRYKRIRDYGMAWTKELRELYNFFFALRFNQDWEK